MRNAPHVSQTSMALGGPKWPSAVVWLWAAPIVCLSSSLSSFSWSESLRIPWASSTSPWLPASSALSTKPLIFSVRISTFISISSCCAGDIPFAANCSLWSSSSLSFDLLIFIATSLSSLCENLKNSSSKSSFFLLCLACMYASLMSGS